MWDYLVIEEGNPASLQTRLSSLGREGWEALGVACAAEHRQIVVLKRPLSNAVAGTADSGQAKGTTADAS
jgi:hypothetical protein